MNPLLHYLYALSADHSLPNELYQYVKNAHPQINDTTKLAFVPYLNWNLVKSDEDYYLVQRYRWIWAGRPGCKGRVWRVIGALLDRADLFSKGIAWSSQPAEPTLPTYTKQLRLKGYGASKVGMGNRIDLVIYLAYEPSNDTLYIRRD